MNLRAKGSWREKRGDYGFTCVVRKHPEADHTVYGFGVNIVARAACPPPAQDPGVDVSSMFTTGFGLEWRAH